MNLGDVLDDRLDLAVSKSASTRRFRILRESGLIDQRVETTRHRNWPRRTELDRCCSGLLEQILEALEPTDAWS